jgi:hypothetical protein
LVDVQQCALTAIRLCTLILLAKAMFDFPDNPSNKNINALPMKKRYFLVADVKNCLNKAPTFKWDIPT